MSDERRLELEERRRVPWDAVILGWGPMLPFPAALAAVWAGWHAEAATELIRLWAAAVALFFSGVRRGLSFRTEGGPQLTQLAMFAWLFWAGLAALLLPVSWALGLLTAVYASVWILDPLSARAGEAPLYFMRLRPWQMAVPVVCLGMLVVVGAIK